MGDYAVKHFAGLQRSALQIRPRGPRSTGAWVGSPVHSDRSAEHDQSEASPAARQGLGCAWAPARLCEDMPGSQHYLELAGDWIGMESDASKMREK